MTILFTLPVKTRIRVPAKTPQSRTEKHVVTVSLLIALCGAKVFELRSFEIVKDSEKKPNPLRSKSACQKQKRNAGYVASPAHFGPPTRSLLHGSYAVRAPLFRQCFRVPALPLIGMGQRNPFALISQPRSCRDRHYTEINLCDQATPDHRKEDFN